MNLLMTLAAAAVFVIAAGVLRLTGADAKTALAAGGAAVIATGVWLAAVAG